MLENLKDKVNGALALGRIALTHEKSVKLKRMRSDIQDVMRELAPKMQELHQAFKSHGYIIEYQIGIDKGDNESN